MSIVSINSNVAAYSAQAAIQTANDEVTSSVARLSTGNAIVQASDNVAALAIGQGLLTNVSTLKVAQQNATLGISLLQVADGALSQIQSILQQQASLAAQSNSGSLSDTQRGFLDEQFQALSQQINNIVAQTNFNGVTLLDGSLSSTNSLQVATEAQSDPATMGVIGGFTALSTNVTAATIKASTGTGTMPDQALVGDLGDGTWAVSYSGTGFNLAYTINGQSYVANDVVPTNTGGKIDLINTNATAATSSDAMLELTTAGSISATYAASNAGALALQTALQGAFSGATAYAVHVMADADVSNGAGGTINNSSIAASSTSGTNFTNGTLLNGFTGNDVTLQSSAYNSASAAYPSISGFTATGSGGDGEQFSVTVGGQTYIAGKALTTDANDTLGGTTYEDLSTGAAYGSAGTMIFYLNGDGTSDDKLTLNFSGTSAAAKIGTTGEVNNVLSELNDLFAGGGAGGLNFQVGTASNDVIGVSIGDNSTTSLFAGASLSVATQADAATAATAVNTAINTVTASRASVGAQESQFNFTNANLSTAVQNQASAESNLLDTNVASESTNFATEQVQLQAGIAVLAQANQQQQNLLKLIG